MKFLLFFVIAVSYILARIFFGKNTLTKKDYLIYWLKSSLFTGLTLDVFLTYVDWYKKSGPFEIVDLDFKSIFTLLAIGFIFSFISAAVIIGGLIYKYEYPRKLTNDTKQ